MLIGIVISIEHTLAHLINRQTVSLFPLTNGETESLTKKYQKQDLKPGALIPKSGMLIIMAYNYLLGKVIIFHVEMHHSIITSFKTPLYAK